jgi:cell division transport system permease protein
MKAPRIAVIISISLVLFLLGIMGLIMMYSNSISTSVKENLSVTLVLKEGLGQTDALSLANDLKTEPYVKQIKVVDAEEGAELMKKELGEDFVAFIGYNPLSAVVEVYFLSDLSSPELLSSFTERMQANKMIKEVRMQTGLLQKLENTTRSISFALLAVSLLFLLVSITLIYQSISISIYAHRFSIRTMQLVGATRWFILQPYLKQGIWDGFSGGIASLLLICSTWLTARKNIPGLTDLEDPVKLQVLGISILITGLFISIFSTIFALSRFLKADPDKLY